MKPKKNPKKDLRKNSGLYFSIGLMLVLACIYVAFEWKTFDQPIAIDIGMNNPDSELTEELPPVIIPEKLPPPPPVAPSIIEIKKDDDPIIETIIEVTEPTEEPPIAIEAVEYEEPEPEIKVNWISIEEVPVFPGCEDAKDKRVCFQKMMNKHISKVFRYPESAQEMNIQGKVYTEFTIEADGSIGGIRLRGPHKVLETESARIISKLPTMKPGKQRDKNVKVSFSIPINFVLQ